MRILFAFFSVLIFQNCNTKSNQKIAQNQVIEMSDEDILLTPLLDNSLSINYTDTAISAIYVRRGNIFFEHNEYDSAFIFYKKALKLREEIGDIELICNTYASIADVYDNAGLTDSFRSAYKFIFSNRKIEKNKISDYINYSVLAAVDAANGGFYASFLDSAIRLCDKYQDSVNKNIALYNQAIYYGNLGQSSKADTLLNILISAHKKQKNWDKLSKVYHAKSVVHSINEVKLHYLDTAIYYAKLSQDKQFLSNSLQLKAEILEEQGAHRQAFNLMQQVSLLKDSIFGEEIASTIGNEKVRYEQEKKDNQNLRLTLENNSKQNWIYVILGLALAVFGAIYYSYRHYMKQKDHQTLLAEQDKKLAELNLETMRSKVSMDIHDDVSASISAIRIYSDMLGKMKHDPNIVSTFSTKITKSIIELSHNLKTLVWSLNEENDTIYSLAEYIKSYVHSSLENTDIHLKYEAELADENAVIDGNYRKHLYLCVKEIIHNAVKYSQAKLIEVSIVSNKERKLVIRISDNGIGIPSNAKWGNGIKNIERRMKELEGEVSRTSENGTQYKLEILY